MTSLKHDEHMIIAALAYFDESRSGPGIDRAVPYRAVNALAGHSPWCGKFNYEDIERIAWGIGWNPKYLHPLPTTRPLYEALVTGAGSWPTAHGAHPETASPYLTQFNEAFAAMPLKQRRQLSEALIYLHCDGVPNPIIRELANRTEVIRLGAATAKNADRNNTVKLSTSTSAQTKRVLTMLKEKPSNTLEFRAAAVPHPAGRIADLRKAGHTIKTTQVKAYDETGHCHLVAEYSLLEEKTHG